LSAMSFRNLHQSLKSIRVSVVIVPIVREIVSSSCRDIAFTSRMTVETVLPALCVLISNGKSTRTTFSAPHLPKALDPIPLDE
jgi:hypothetical protein